MAEKKPLSQRKRVSHEDFEKEARELRREINKSIRNIKKQGRGEDFEESKNI